MSRPQRLDGFDYRGRYPYFVTFCTRQRRDALADAWVAGMVRRQILRSAAREPFAVLAYCLMPDHVHLLLHAASHGADLRRCVKRTKQSSGQVYAGRVGRPLWQEGYYEHVVRPEEDLSGIARYIIENPVRAGLARSPLEYPYVGSEVWSVETLLRGGPV